MLKTIFIYFYFCKQAEFTFNSGPPVEFLDPPDKVEVCVAQKALLRCEFRSSSLPVACCWIYNRSKVKLLLF